MDQETTPTNAIETPSEYEYSVRSLRLRIQNLQLKLEWLIKHQAVLEPMGLTTIMPLDSTMDIDNPTREQVVAIIQALPGEWKKELNGSNPTKIDYSARIGGQTVRLWCSPPPPSCKIVEREMIVPAVAEHKRIVRVLQCSETEPAPELAPQA